VSTADFLRLRTSLVWDVRRDRILDDSAIALAAIRGGERRGYREDAIRLEDSPQTARREFRRRIRIEVGVKTALSLGEAPAMGTDIGSASTNRGI